MQPNVGVHSSTTHHLLLLLNLRSKSRLVSVEMAQHFKSSSRRKIVRWRVGV